MHVYNASERKGAPESVDIQTFLCLKVTFLKVLRFSGWHQQIPISELMTLYTKGTTCSPQEVVKSCTWLILPGAEGVKHTSAFGNFAGTRVLGILMAVFGRETHGQLTTHYDPKYQIAWTTQSDLVWKRKGSPRNHCECFCVGLQLWNVYVTLWWFGEIQKSKILEYIVSSQTNHAFGFRWWNKEKQTCFWLKNKPTSSLSSAG